MSEQQIRDGFEQLEGALAPPPDTTRRVDRLVRVRRRRRRTGLGVGAVAGVAALGAVVFVGVSGDDGSGTPVAVETPPGLTMERPDGSTYAFDVDVSCDPPMTQGDRQPIGDPAPGTIWASSPISLQGSLETGEEPTLDHPFVMIQGTVAKLQGDRTFQLPIDGPGNSNTYPLVLFIADTEGGTPGDPGNEAASSAGGSGTVRVLEASCDPVPVLRLEVDGVLGSEEGKQDLKLVGELR